MVLLSNSSQNLKLLSRSRFALHAHNNDQLKDMREICLAARRTFEVKGRRWKDRERGNEKEREREGEKERERELVRHSAWSSAAV